MVKSFRVFISSVVVTTTFGLGIFSAPLKAETPPFTVEQVQVTGNARISFETINSYLPVAVGERLTSQRTQESIKALYRTGFFKDVSIWQAPGNKLLIEVVERPSISDIKIEGNSLINTEDMEMSLSGLGVKKGRIFNAIQMDKIILDIKRQYQNQGYYAADVTFKTEALPRNRVALNIIVEEGEPASIGRITFVGNYAYADNEIQAEMLLGEDDKYAKPKLQSDLETIKSFYMDRGFAEFKIRSSQVSLSLDKTKVFLTINLTEGPQYTVVKLSFSGDVILKDADLRALLNIKESAFFNRSAVIRSINNIKNALGEEGYAFAAVDPITSLDSDLHEVAINFRMEPKNRVYIRRIEIEGNTRTSDRVIRREIRKLESSVYSLAAINRSKTRLTRTGYFSSAHIETRRITEDTIDLVIKVKEQSTGSFQAGISYSQLDGTGFTMGVTERNVVGSGYTANLNGRYTKSSQSLDLGVTNPYFTVDGVSLGGGLYLKQLDAAELGVADYSINNLGARITMGYPINELTKISYGVRLDSQELLCQETFSSCVNYVNSNGKVFDSTKLSISWSRDSKNAFYFPTEGQITSASLELTTPINDSGISFYKVSLKESLYIPLASAVTFRLKTNLSFGESITDGKDYPFFENYYAGGIGSVRGFDPNSLGAHYDLTADRSTSPKGGKVKLISTAELVIPLPFIDDSSNLRVSLFVDAGNVYDGFENFDANELRVSTGVGISWITPVGPLAFSLARPLVYDENDSMQQFQFNLGIPM